MTALVLNRADNMPGLNSLELDEVHTPSSNYSYSQANMLSTGSGLFSYHTGPADLSAWETTAEGTQNFPEFSDAGDFYSHGDSEEYSLPFGHMTPMQDHPESVDEYHQKLATATAVNSRLPSSEPMRRVTSISSVASHRSHKSHKSHKARAIKPSSSSKKSGTKMSSALSRAPSQMSNFDMTGNGTAFQEESVGNGQILNGDHYLTPPESVSSQAFYPGIMALPADGLPYADLAPRMAQHVNPISTQMHLDFEPSLHANSPSHSWDTGSSGSSPLSLDDPWTTAQLVTSPTETVDSSPEIVGREPRIARPLGSHHLVSADVHTDFLTGMGHDDFTLPPSAGLPRQGGDGESARDHPLYKNASPGADGLFHCPWEGQPVCNHKAEKLKCNYDKFVDSHLKPYRCKHDSCENAKFSSTACLLRHEREAHAMHGHGDKPYLCTYEGCERSISGNGFPRHWNLRDHMRRVHSDTGASVPAVPSGSPPTQGSGNVKGKKRKSKDSTDSSSNRKSSTKSNSSMDTASNKTVDHAVDADVDQWYEHQKVLMSLGSGFTTPDAPGVLQHIKDAQDRLSHMSRISQRLVMTQKPDVLQRDWQRSFPEQSG